MVKFSFVVLGVAAAWVGALSTAFAGFSQSFEGMLTREARTVMAADLTARQFVLPSSGSNRTTGRHAGGPRRCGGGRWITEIAVSMAERHLLHRRRHLPKQPRGHRLRKTRRRNGIGVDQSVCRSFSSYPYYGAV